MKGVLGTHTLVRSTWGMMVGTRGRAVRGRVPELEVCVPCAAQLPTAFRASSPRRAEAACRALLLAPVAAQPPALRPVPTTCCTSCAWRLLDGSGTWWRKRCNSGGRRGRELASAWEQPPCGVPHGRDTRGGIRWRPGTTLPASSMSVDALGEQALGNLVPSDFCSMSSARLHPELSHYMSL